MATVACSYTHAIALLHCLLFFSIPQAQQPQVPPSALNQKPCNTVSAIFVFGDSTVDPGNNNYLATPLKSNFPPYGRDFLGHLATGRFTNGRLATDFLASYLGLKDQVPPYLDWTLGASELETGVSFASAGSGYDLLTAQISGVIPVLHQLDYFKDYLAKLDLLMGRRRSQDLIRQAVFVVSAGTNDFVVNYLSVPIRQQRFNLQDYQNFLLHNIRDFLQFEEFDQQGLEELGAQKIVVVGLPPMGCLPIVITLNWKGGFGDRGCIQAYNALSRDFNEKLQIELRYLQSRFAADGGQILYANIYDPLINLILSPSKFGFADAANGCCGTGLVEAALLCNLKSIVCSDASKYVFWDSIHPTEKTYFIVFNSLRQLIDRAC
ncbi:hypothetical protein Taro_033609 [Colocasia esculenta]|uniref:GDSL esterase/lipase n=1 Tax=Colocasia esculenta TaxID=4460 RepID=A0A843W7H3_COLES|nr:hypothetical protein [Colocasia esculenta]